MARSVGVLLILFVALSASAQTVTVTITDPAADPVSGKRFSGDNLTIKAVVSSTYQIDHVTATVADRTTNLTYSMTESKWVGSLSLAGLMRGNQQLTVTAVDVFGNSGSQQVTIVYDNPPNITVTSPDAETVARPLIRVTASCTDDGGCASFQVLLGQFTDQAILSGQTSYDQFVSLDAYEGQQVNLTFRAVDTAGQVVTIQRIVYVDSDPHLHEVVSATAGGRVVDVDAGRILYLNATGHLVIRDRMSAMETTIPNDGGRTPRTFLPAYLTSHGAIFVAEGADSTDAAVNEWRDGVLLTFGLPNGLTSLKVNGQHAVWTGYTGLTSTGPIHLFVRDLAAGTTTDVPFSGSFGNTENHVAEDGTAAFWGNDFNIYLYHSSVVQITTATMNVSYFYPRTDGTKTAYVKKIGCCTYAVALNDGATEQEISPQSAIQPNPDKDYQVRNGWVAVTRNMGNGVFQAFLISPTGDEQQLTVFGSSASIDYLAGNGEITVKSDDARQRLLRTATAAPHKISSALGFSKTAGSEWDVAIGRSVFALSDTFATTITSLTTSANPAALGDAITFTATVTSAGNAATGTVAFREGTSTIATATLSGGVATFTTGMSLGTHDIVAIYGGDQNFSSSVSNTIHQEVKNGTSTTLASSLNPSTVGQSVTFTATVSGAAGGLLDFKDGNTILATVTVPSTPGTATYTTSALSVGSHSMTAVYHGDSGHVGSTSPVLTQQVLDGFGPPSVISATAVGTSQVSVMWSAVSGANHYEVFRSFNNGMYSLVASPSVNSFTDTDVTAGITYLYKVRAIDAGSNASGFSVIDPATVMVFTDDPLTPGVIIQAVHVNELQDAVNAMRKSVGLEPLSFGGTKTPGMIIRLDDIVLLRSYLNDARSRIPVPLISFTEPTLTGLVTTVKAVHVQEIRDGCK